MYYDPNGLCPEGKPAKVEVIKKFGQPLKYTVEQTTDVGGDVTLAVMTVPAIISATGSPLAGALALVAGIAAAWAGLGLFPVALICCAVVFLLETIL